MSVRPVLPDAAGKRNGETTMAIYIANAFSIQMVRLPARVTASAVGIAEVVSAINSQHDTQWAIGHEDAAAVAVEQLKKAGLTMRISAKDAYRRRNIQLKPGDILYVLQAYGGRLPLGCTSLPPGIVLSWIKVELME